MLEKNSFGICFCNFN